MVKTKLIVWIGDSAYWNRVWRDAGGHQYVRSEDGDMIPLEKVSVTLVGLDDGDIDK